MKRAAFETELAKLRAENQRLRRSVQELSVLNDVAVAISSARSLDTIIELIVNRCVKHFGVEQAAVMLLEQADKSPSFHTVVRKADQSSVRLPYRLDAQLTGWMLQHREPLLVNDLNSDQRFTTARTPDCPIRSLLAVPLFLKGQMLGLIGLFNKRDVEGFSKDDQRLLSILATESAQVIENARLAREERELQRIQEELRMASEIQKNLLPLGPPAVPGYDVYGVNVPARAVGGDYFDFLLLPGGKLALCVGDVSGKGMPAALLMANLQATLRSQILLGLPVHQCVGNANFLLYHDTPPEKFATLFYGVLDTQSHVLTYCNAGHNPPWVLKSDGSVAELQTGGTALGFLEHFEYKQDQTSLQPGDVLLVYSDGITEAMTADERQFGEERLLKEARQAQAEPSETLAGAILDAVDSFTEEAPRSDDQTLVVAKRLT